MRKEYEFSEEQSKKMIEMLKPSKLLMLDGKPEDQQKRVNRAWEALGKEMGFKWETVRPVDGKPAKYFSAEPVEELDQEGQPPAE